MDPEHTINSQSWQCKTHYQQKRETRSMSKQSATKRDRATQRKSNNDPSKHQYHFALNPYPDARVTSCPQYGKKTSSRKLPLFIHIEPKFPIALNYTNRYCANCDLLIAHQAEIEAHLTRICSQMDPTLIGNEYLVVGVLERKVWRDSVKNPKPPNELIQHVHTFKSYMPLRRTKPGWYPDGVEPPVEEPPASEEWVKRT